MKKYYVKLGNMYLREIYTDNELYSNNLIRNVEFDYGKNLAIRISENDKLDIAILLEHIFDMSGVLRNYITFEEVKEDE